MLNIRNNKTIFFLIFFINILNDSKWHHWEFTNTSIEKIYDAIWHHWDVTYNKIYIRKFIL